MIPINILLFFCFVFVLLDQKTGCLLKVPENAMVADHYSRYCHGGFHLP